MGIEKDIEALLEDINPKEGLISMLQKVQEKFNYIPAHAIKTINERFDIPLADIYGVSTFYSQFRLQPRGKHLVKVCRGTACHVSGSARLLNEMPVESSLFSVEEVACLGCCSLAPVMMIDTEVYGKLDRKKIEEIFKKYEQSNRNSG